MSSAITSLEAFIGGTKGAGQRSLCVRECAVGMEVPGEEDRERKKYR